MTQQTTATTTDQIAYYLPPQETWCPWCEPVRHCPGCGRPIWPGHYPPRIDNPYQTVWISTSEVLC